MSTTTAEKHATDGPSDEHPVRSEHHHIAIVGSGFAGLGAAVRLRQAGIDDFVVLERGEEVGGTWSFNTYPGCQCDIPSHLYSLSFAPNPDWSRTYSRQPEIRRYLQRVASEHGVNRHVRLRCELTGADWDEQAQRWRLKTSDDDELTADILIAAAGPLSEPKLPDIPGIESFAGTIFHSAQWDHGHDYTGERVAVIGTGASSIQFVPHLQRAAAKLHVFQRTPPWIVAHSDRRTTRIERWLYRRAPAAQRIVRAAIYLSRELFVPFLMNPRAGSLPEQMARRHLQRQVTDPALRARLTPDYRIGCKRVLISNAYYPALQAPNVELVTDAIAAVQPDAIVTREGVRREVDTIVLGTGFHVTDMPIAQLIRGREGVTLAQHWQGSPRAYLGSTVAGFPNMFMLVGPNMGLGHNSIVFMIEAQLNYVIDCLQGMDRSGMDVFDVREDVEEVFNEELQRRLRGSVWTSGGCSSWYLDAQGHNSTIWPGFTWTYRRRTRRFLAADYTLQARRRVHAPDSAEPADTSLVAA